MALPREEATSGGFKTTAAHAIEDKPALGSMTKSTPVFVEIASLAPQQSGFSLRAKILSITPIIDRLNLDGSRLRISEALIGDSSGTVLLSLRNDQLEQAGVGDTIFVRNAKIDIVGGGFIRVAVDRWGRIQKDDSPLTEAIKETNNMSAVEYELITS